MHLAATASLLISLVSVSMWIKMSARFVCFIIIIIIILFQQVSMPVYLSLFSQSSRFFHYPFSFLHETLNLCHFSDFLPEAVDSFVSHPFSQRPLHLDLQSTFLPFKPIPCAYSACNSTLLQIFLYYYCESISDSVTLLLSSFHRIPHRNHRIPLQLRMHSPSQMFLFWSWDITWFSQIAFLPRIGNSKATGACLHWL